MNIKTGFDHKVTGVMILSLVVYAVVIVMNLQQGNEQGGKNESRCAVYTAYCSHHLSALFFAFFASVIGSCFGGYRLSFFFHKVLRFSSGFLTASAAAAIYMRPAEDPCQQSKTGMHYFCCLFFINLADDPMAEKWYKRIFR